MGISRAAVHGDLQQLARQPRPVTLESMMLVPPPIHHSSFQVGAHDRGTTRECGLSSRDAAQRLVEVGPNALTERPGKSAWSIVREQLTAVMMLVLLVAAAISVALGDMVDALAILAIVALNAALGFQQEFRAERAMEALKRMTVPLVKVR